ncbi:MarR family winged helix-turn-helix transcriptional regulator [Krasilnikovia sp. MM14-A1004]|uniref:MarR family winged helix-turn-helix transcriptional regulator n=1 Tax=Krasilnikovia sp. MM14-A1004 TaxID=3373541 RepID=UPI00399D2CCA
MPHSARPQPPADALPADASAPTAGQLIDLFALATSAYFQDFAAVAAQHGLTSTQAKVLILLREPRTMRGLAEELICDASNVTGIIDRLEGRGLVRREVDPTDRRIKNAFRTEAGDEAIRHVRADMQTTQRALADLSDDDRTALADLLRRLHRGLEDRV